jgi:hypothetical protein
MAFVLFGVFHERSTTTTTTTTMTTTTTTTARTQTVKKHYPIQKEEKKIEFREMKWNKNRIR